MRDQILDHAHLEDVCCGDTSLLAELVALYHEQGEGAFQQLMDAVAADDRASIRTVAHGLKGSSASIGAVQAAACFSDLEQTAPGGPAEVLPDLIERAAAAYKATCVALVAVSSRAA